MIVKHLNPKAIHHVLGIKQIVEKNTYFIF